MIPTHLLQNLAPGDRVAILSRDGDLRFHVHPAADDPAAVRAFAEREGCEVVRTHLRDPESIRAIVADRERDVGGES